MRNDTNPWTYWMSLLKMKNQEKVDAKDRDAKGNTSFKRRWWV